MTKGEAAVVPQAELRTYYDRPVLKEPIWKWSVPAYFFTGGLAGASATLARAARRRGNDRLARSALLAASAGIAASPALLVEDLGRPERFLNMLRVVKPTSPMSVGSWLLAAAGPAIAGATLSDLTGRARGLGRALESAGGALGPALAAYTAVLVADTAVPVWHEARRELPFVFAASAATSAGAAATALTPLADAGPARRLAVTAALAELGVSSAMERSLGDLGDAYHSGRAARYTRTAKGLTGAGALLMATAARRRRAGALAASALLMAGSLVTRFAVFEAGVQSSRDPRQTVRSQRRAAREDE